MKWLLLAFVALGAGCTSLPPSNGPDENHYRLAGERVEVRLITFDAWNGVYQSLLTKRAGHSMNLPPQPEPAAWLPEARQDADRTLPDAEVSALLGVLAGVFVDAVQASIEAEARTHEQQYRQSTSADDFWVNGRPNYAGFEVVRFVDSANAAEKALASRLVFAFQYSRYDPRIVNIRPVFASVDAAKARVSGSDGSQRLRIKSDIIIDSSWVASGQGSLELHTARLGVGSITIGGYGLGTGAGKTRSPEWHATWNSSDAEQTDPDVPGERHWPWTGELAGLASMRFLAPQPSADRTRTLDKADLDQVQQLRGGLQGIEQSLRSLEPEKESQRATLEQQREEALRTLEQKMNAFSGGAFTVSVIVTESDESKVAEHLIRVADFVGSQRDTVVQWAQERGR